MFRMSKEEDKGAYFDSEECWAATPRGPVGPVRTPPTSHGSLGSPPARNLQEAEAEIMTQTQGASRCLLRVSKNYLESNFCYFRCLFPTFATVKRSWHRVEPQAVSNLRRHLGLLLPHDSEDQQSGQFRVFLWFSSSEPTITKLHVLPPDLTCTLENTRTNRTCLAGVNRHGAESELLRVTQ